jgi:serine/threonine-protein phosphatase PGAM5
MRSSGARTVAPFVRPDNCRITNAAGLAPAGRPPRLRVMIRPRSRVASIPLAIGALILLAPPPVARAAHPPGQGVRTVILVRHGIYDEDDPRDPRVGHALTDRGREQARLTGVRLAALPVHVDGLWTSTFTRARETADLIASALHEPAVRDSDLCECTPPTTREDIMKNERPGSLDSCVTQLDRVYARYIRPSPARDSVVVLVAHGNVIRSLLTRAIGLDPKGWLVFALPNCSVSVLLVQPDGRVRVVSIGDVGHLPPDLQTLPTPMWDAGAPAKK